MILGKEMKNSKPTICLLGQSGRLGNRLWTYANVLAYALENNFIVCNPRFKVEEKQFFIAEQEQNSFDNYIFPFIAKINLRANLFPYIILKDGDLINLDAVSPELFYKKNLIFMYGFYFYAAKCLEKHSSLVQNLLRPSNQVSQKVESFIEHIKKKEEADILIGVHIRHGDYRTYCNGIMFYSVLEYIEVMRCLKSQFIGKSVAFIVCSDEKQNLSEYPDLNIYYGLGEKNLDLYTLSKCDYIFGPNSSFSHWASFFGQVPLHILDYKAEIAKRVTPVLEPSIVEHFTIFSPYQFGKYASNILLPDDILVKK